MNHRIESISFQGLPAYRLFGPRGVEAVLSQHGGQLLSWKTAGGRERLFLSSQAKLDGQAAIRGGVPVCFPQFAAQGNLPRHGLLRTRTWTLTGQSADQSHVSITLGVTDDEASRACWPHAFAAELTVMLEADRLDIELAVENTGASDFAFQAALHTYLRVVQVEDVALAGLYGAIWREGEVQRRESGTELVPEAAIDRVYSPVRQPLLLHAGNLSLGIHSEGFPDVVVWNPWQEGAATLPDLADGEWRHFLCVEAAAIERPVSLPPGETWFARQTLVPV